jgi:hypothetical protein
MQSNHGKKSRKNKPVGKPVFFYLVKQIFEHKITPTTTQMARLSNVIEYTLYVGPLQRGFPLFFQVSALNPCFCVLPLPKHPKNTDHRTQTTEALAPRARVLCFCASVLLCSSPPETPQEHRPPNSDH